ncbi:PAS domain-containing protein [Candidatus Sumerlaeota bacterium]|nr:PAS domain-containing protein [Candidatus Sumerlaeota bacterium]
MTPSTSEHLRFVLDRRPGVCLIETDAHGIFTHFGPGAEAFFGCPASEALGKLRYDVFHDPDEMKACHADPKFQAEMRDPGWSEDDWKIIPRSGDAFMAKVTLMPARGEYPDGAIIGWMALYRKLDPENEAAKAQRRQSKG